MPLLSRRHHLQQVLTAVQRADDRTVTWMRTVDHGRLRPVLRAAAAAGDVLTPPVASSLWVAAEGTPEERNAVLRGWAAMALAATVENGVLKPVIQRGRPDAQRLPRRQRRSSSPATSSLPAGHTGSVVAFSIAAGRGVPRLRGWMAASVLLLVYAHLYTGRHYLSDAVVGTVIGATAGGLCSRVSAGSAAQEDSAHHRSDQGTTATPSRGDAAKRKLLDRSTVVDGDTIHSRETPHASGADAPRVILVHGVGATARYFGPLLRELDGRTPAAAVELPGIGGSSASQLPRDISQQADVLAAWLRETGRHPAVLVGNSMGAQTVVELAVRHPSLVERLVLIGPTMDPAARSPLSQIRRLLVDATVERPSLIALTLSDSLRTRRRAVYRYFRAALDHDIEQRIALVSAPILVMRGERDPVAPRRWARELAAAAPQGRFVEVPDAAHAAHHGRPRLVADLLLDALSSAESDLSRPTAT